MTEPAEQAPPGGAEPEPYAASSDLVSPASAMPHALVHSDFARPADTPIERLRGWWRARRMLRLDARPRDTVARATVGPDEPAQIGVDFLAHVDAQLRITHIPDASLEFLGRTREDVDGRRVGALVTPGQVDALERLFEQAVHAETPTRGAFELPSMRRAGMHVELRVTALTRGPGPGLFLLTGINVSAWVRSAERAEYELTHDSLTGLGNRLLAQRQIESYVADSVLGDAGLTVLAIDLDRFKRINLGLGYEAGDHLLRETAGRLHHAVAPTDTVARTGGDRFVVLTPLQERAELSRFARRILSTILQPYEYGRQRLHLSACVGVAMAHDVPDDAVERLRGADSALHEAKKSGGNAFRFYSGAQDAAAVDSLKLEADIFEGIRNGEFSLHYQPIADIRDLTVVGVEALMRWQRPNRGAVPPVVFIPLAEAVGLIDYLGAWALKSACMQLARWDAQGFAVPYVAVNVSAQQFSDGKFVDTLRDTLRLTGVDAGRIVLEITESVLMHDAPAARTILRDCAALGARFAVDDFGTGYSNLAYLQRFALDELKIDRVFIENLTTSANDRGIVAAVAALARSLKLKLVAEGVESEAQRKLLTTLGCAHMQGWLLSKALPADELLERLRSGELKLTRQADPACAT